MITLDLGDVEEYDHVNNEFKYYEGGIVRFEYSLKALYEWEGIWCKPFLSPNVKLNNEEVIDFYIKMALDPIDRRFITNEVSYQLAKYIADSNTATRFNEPASTGGKSRPSGKVHTSEEIYALMAQANIPFEWENRNLNRLLVMLRIISTQNSPSKKMSKQDVMKQNANINAQRKARLNTKG